MKHICYIISGIDKALAFEWIIEYLDKDKYKLFFVLLHNKRGGLENHLILHHITYIRIAYQNKSHLPKAVSETYGFLRKNHIDVVHCHLLDAGLAGMIASFLAGIKHRIYTRHYSSYHHVYYPKGIWYDKIINRLSTKIVAVSKLVKDILIEQEHVNSDKIQVIHHGFPLSRFEKVSAEDINTLKQKYCILNKFPVIGVISRYTEWKGIQYIIPAFKNLLVSFPEAHLILANAKGAYQKEIEQLTGELPVSGFTEITFEDDLFTLFKCFDLFVHVPVDYHSEAFGQVYVEAMAAEKPCIFTLSGIASEILIHQSNAVVVPYKNSLAVFSAIEYLLANPVASSRLASKAKEAVRDQFKLETMIKELEKLYA